MAVTSPDPLWTPDTGDNYALTTDLAAMADTVQETFTKKANYGVGTTAEMNAAIGRFPDGAMWYNVTNSTEYRRISGAWVSTALPPGIPFAMAAGVADIQGTGSATATTQVDLPVGRFSETPIVTVAADNSQYIAAYNSAQSSSSTIQLGVRVTTVSSFNNVQRVYWAAVQMTPTSAEG